MTHDELRDYIDKFDAAGMVKEPVVAALRAVVEMHKPFQYEGRFGTFLRCSHCKTEEEFLGEIYPCPTIQAIEKELA